METILNIFLGVMTGAYSSFVVTRYHEFRTIREEICRVVYNYGTISDWNEKLQFLSSSLNRLNYSKASKKVDSICKELKSIIPVHAEGKFELPDINQAGDMIQRVNKAKSELKELKFPAWKIIFPF
jgi:hypothetical protein